jgi:hypothetical protein
MSRGLKAWVGMTVIGLTVALVPALSAPASASTHTAAKGSHPKSPLCKAYRTSFGGNPSAAEATKAGKALKAGNWPAAQKALLGAFGVEAHAVLALQATVSGAPKAVKAAAAELATYSAKIDRAITKSKNFKQFTAAFAPLIKSHKVTAAESTLAKYAAGVCGSAAIL